MPNVYKQPAFSKTGTPVKIPDVPRAVTTAPETEELQRQEEEPPEVRFEPVMPTRQELINRCQEELEDIRQEAARQAYADAINSKRGEVQACIDRVDRLLRDMQKKQSEFMERFSYELRFLAIDIAQTIMLAKIQEDDSVLKDLVVQTTGRIHNADWLDVQVSEELAGLVVRLKEEFQKPEYRGRVSVSPKPGPIDTVRVDTQLGAVDATISQQTESLREIFRGE